MATKTNHAALTNALKPAKGNSKPAAPTKAEQERDATIRDACIASLGLYTASQQVKNGKTTLASMADRLAKAGVNSERVKAARESFGLTLHAVLGVSPPARTNGNASADAIVRALVKGMADAVGITASALGAAVNTEQRKALYSAPLRALQRLAPPAQKASTKPADVYEAATSWAAKLAKDFESFRPKSVKDKDFQRFAQVLFDSLTGVGTEA